MAIDKVTEILVKRILKTIETEKKLPWQKPWQYRYAMNYCSRHVYKGINRWLLPAGEYMTKNQLNAYNKSHGTNYRFKKGIEWLPVLFMKRIECHPRSGELDSDEISTIMSGKAIRKGSLCYYFSEKENCVMKSYLCRRYYSVAEIKWFVDENGNSPVSQVESGLVEFTIEKPEYIIEAYTSRERVGLFHDSFNGAYYHHPTDSVHIPRKTDFKREECYYSTVFHELAHSTGSAGRLNRKEVVSMAEYRVKENRSREELIAEMCACLLCAESGINEIDMSDETESFALKNSQAYIQSWYQYLKDGADDLVYIASDAEKAFKLIMGEDVDSDEEYADRLDGTKNENEE